VPLLLPLLLLMIGVAGARRREFQRTWPSAATETTSVLFVRGRKRAQKMLAYKRKGERWNCERVEFMMDDGLTLF
jgi:hypothetical protein